MNNTESNEFKVRERDAWASVADGWIRRDELLRKGAEAVTRRMLELADISDGHNVLDIASGTGEPSISAARLTGDMGRVIGTDLTEEMLPTFASRENPCACAAQPGLPPQQANQ